jgi:hypothetical protein
LKSLKGRNNLGDLGVGGRLILLYVGCKGVEQIHLAQDRVYWLAVVSTVMNIQVP